LYSSSNNILRNNNASDNLGWGIHLSCSDNNEITKNNASDNDGCGIHLERSDNNEITKNNAYPNRKRGIQIDASSGKNRIYMNNFNGSVSVAPPPPQIKFSPCWVKYYDHTTAMAHCGFENEGGSGTVTFEVWDWERGVLHDTVTFYVSSGGYYDFEIVTCLYHDPINPRRTTLVVRSLSATSTLQIDFEGQTYSVVIFRPHPVDPVVEYNFLNSTEEINYTYKGNNYTNYLGNYWSNYEEEYPNATEIDSTGIWDTPYSIELGVDNYPLVEPGENYFPEEKQPPIVNFTYSPSQPIINEIITLNASSSYDPDGGNITKYEWDFGDGNITNITEPIITHFYTFAQEYIVNLTVTDDEGAMNSTNKTIIVYPPAAGFDTGAPANPYPSIFGTHNGTITPNKTITVSKLYTYPCIGTGGHGEYIRIYNETGTLAVGYWKGYQGDYHNITLMPSIKMLKDREYNYTIITGSYPQIIHKQNHTTLYSSLITCTEFIDANGKRYIDWIPAIRLV
jgi:parallel beta-helix repeat protein